MSRHATVSKICHTLACRANPSLNVCRAVGINHAVACYVNVLRNLAKSIARELANVGSRREVARIVDNNLHAAAHIGVIVGSMVVKLEVSGIFDAQPVKFVVACAPSFAGIYLALTSSRSAGSTGTPSRITAITIDPPA